MLVLGCGFNGFCQLGCFESLNPYLNNLRSPSCHNEVTGAKAANSSKVMSPVVLLPATGHYNVDKLLISWSRIAVTFKTADSSCLSAILGFRKCASGSESFETHHELPVSDKRNQPVTTGIDIQPSTLSRHSRHDVVDGWPLVLDGCYVLAATDADIFYSRGQAYDSFHIQTENKQEADELRLSLPGALQMVGGCHDTFFAVYDSTHFGKLTVPDQSAGGTTESIESRYKQLWYTNLHTFGPGLEICELSCGKEHALLLTRSGCVFSYGIGSRGQLGHSSVESEFTPRLVEALEGLAMRTVSAGGWHSTSISEFGDLYVWGWNESGQLGLRSVAKVEDSQQPDTSSEWVGVQVLPVCVSLPEELNVSATACGSRHSVFLTDTGRVFSAGWNAYGQLGLGHTENMDHFTEIETIRNKCVQIFAGNWNTIFICNKDQTS